MTALRFALVGDPVDHSRSPAMHAAAFRALGLAHRYEALRATADDVRRRVAELRAGSFAGLNVTAPHKRLALTLADEIDRSARRSGSCNVLCVRGGCVVAFDTDAAALVAQLEPLRVPLGARALVLGAGGAARSVVTALLEMGLGEVAVRARRREAAQELATALACPIVRDEPWRPAPQLEARTALIVQATSAEMAGAASPRDAQSAVPAHAQSAVPADARGAVAWDALGPATKVLDLVYEPAETGFLRAARARDLHASNGLGVLARQGALALELWLGRPAPLDAMRAALV